MAETITMLGSGWVFHSLWGTARVHRPLTTEKLHNYARRVAGGYTFLAHLHSDRALVIDSFPLRFPSLFAPHSLHSRRCSRGRR